MTLIIGTLTYSMTKHISRDSIKPQIEEMRNIGGVKTIFPAIKF